MCWRCCPDRTRSSKTNTSSSPRISIISAAALQ
jgi:hypothetical protein